MSHIANPVAQNDRMSKYESRQVLAKSLKRFMQRAGIKNPTALARKAKISHSHIRRYLKMESAATVDMLDALADALDVEPWELLTDSDAMRREAIERLLDPKRR